MFSYLHGVVLTTLNGRLYNTSVEHHLATWILEYFNNKQHSFKIFSHLVF